MDRNKQALKSGFWYIFSNLIVRGMTLITTPIFSRLLTHEQYGDYSNYASWTNIAIIVITMRMEASLISAKFDYKDDLEKYIRSIIALTALLTSVWVLFVNIFSSFFSNLLSFGSLYTNLLLSYCFFHAVINIFQMNERYKYQYKKSVFIAVLVAVSTTLVSVFLVVYMSDKLTGRVIGSVIPITIIGIILLMIFFKEDKSIDISVWPYAIKICLPYIPHLLSLQILNYVDRIMIKRICGASDNALYTIAYTCGHMVTLLMTSMNSAFAPWLGDKLNEKSFDEIRKVSRSYIMLFSSAAGMMMLLAPEILLIMGGKSYIEAKYVMPPVALGCICQFLYTLFVDVEQFTKNTTGMAFASVAAALLNYILNSIFIPKYGYIAAAYTTLAGYIFLLMVHMLLVKRINIGDMYDNKFVIIIVILMSAVTLVINYLYSLQTLRIALIGIVMVCVGIFLMKKKDMVKMIVKRIVR